MDHPFRTIGQVSHQRVKARVFHTPTMTTPPVVTLEETALLSFINDVAMGLVGMDTIAARYGITVQEALDLAEAPGIAERIKTRRAIWESEENVMERNRICYGLIALDAAPVIDRQLHNPGTPASVLIDALKVVGRFGGLDSVSKNPTGTEAPPTNPVNIQINFSGGKTETISIAQPPAKPPVIEGEAS